MTSPDAPGRREQNRRRTEQALHEAALACVEQDGYRGATTMRIAEAAGVSPRTFFRYFTTKDEAIAPGQLRVRRRIEQLDLPDSSVSGAITAVADLFEEILDAEEILPELEELPRYERILAEAPELRSAMARHDALITESLVAHLVTHLPDEDPLKVHLAAELMMALWRTSWAHWRSATSGDDDRRADGDTGTADEHVGRADERIGKVGKFGKIDMSPASNFRLCRRDLAPALTALLS